jgi:hypothetical protein
VVVELTGSTGVGKSTLAGRLLERLVERGQPAVSSEMFVARCYGLQLGRLRWPVARSVLIDVLAFPWFVRFVLRRPGWCWFMVRIIWRDSDSLLFRLNVLRNIAKRLGAHELLQRRGCAGEVVIADEGMVHQAHSLFVHPQTAPRPQELARFVADVPVPDLLVLVEGPTPEVVRRTAQRGHQRLPGAQIAQAGPFVERAQAVLRCVVELASERTATAVVRNFGAGSAGLDAALDDLIARLAPC